MFVIILLVSIPGAEAAGAFTFVITGPGMRHPVTVSWDQMSQALLRDVTKRGGDLLHGFNPFFHSVGIPKGSLGPAYDLKMLNFIPSTPPHPLGTEHWTYYPSRDVIRTDDARSPWLQPVPTLRLELDHAIATGKGKNLMWVVVAGILILLAMLALLVAHGRQRFGKRPLLLGLGRSA